MEKSLPKPSKGSLTAIAAGVLVVLAGFVMYNYFSKTGGEITNQAEKTENLEQEKLTKPEDITKGISLEEKEAVLGQSQEKTEWKANDYKSGDIKGGTYTVVKGDTLWEIAQAKYGDPYMWTKIRDANTGSIGQLANGNPLITPGQILVLPD
ncbi:hypothetical protein AUJ94_01895 [bacterium CG2_30_40_12]|nr:MAG: hypothetical protein AUJ94_01895 [bacterium CG2_30_40_12]OJI08530.1 MAG: hypothetical protein BK003_02430 [bacterium CG09_39_24]